MIDIDNWNAWSSWILSSGQPSISQEMDKRLDELRVWLLSRVWPKRYIELESAFENFRRILEDFYRVFHEHSTERGNMFETEKFYKIDRWDVELYNRLGNQFDFHVDLVEDLILELTRAGNYICDKVRKFIIPSFLLKEGALLVTYGPCMGLCFKTVRTEYKGDERALMPYPGLADFKKLRKNRDIHFGEGENAEDPDFLALKNE